MNTQQVFFFLPLLIQSTRKMTQRLHENARHTLIMGAGRRVRRLKTELAAQLKSRQDLLPLLEPEYKRSLGDSWDAFECEWVRDERMKCNSPKVSAEEARSMVAAMIHAQIELGH